MLLIHIKTEVMTVSKNSKVNHPDMIEVIGGTLVVFFGFTFQKLLDRLLHAFQLLWRKVILLK